MEGFEVGSDEITLVLLDVLSIADVREGDSMIPMPEVFVSVMKDDFRSLVYPRDEMLLLKEASFEIGKGAFEKDLSSLLMR